MTDTPKISLDKLWQGSMKAVLTDLEAELTSLNIDFYLIGALARDIWITGVHGISQKRATKDVDLAVLINSKERYAELRQRLLAGGHFTGLRDNQFKLIHTSKTEIDLLPFGGLDREGQVLLAGTGRTAVSVEGFSEVFQSGTQEVDLSGHTYRVCTLPGIVILKLIAYDDRPEARSSDILDIVTIIQSYFNIEQMNIFTRHHDLLKRLENDSDTFKIGARLLGRHMNSIMNSSSPLATRVTGILEKAIQSQQASKLATLMIRDMIGSLEEAQTILKELLDGINDAPLEMEGM